MTRLQVHRSLSTETAVSLVRVEVQLAPSRITGSNSINEGWVVVETHVWSDVRLKGICTAVMGFKVRNPA